MNTDKSPWEVYASLSWQSRETPRCMYPNELVSLLVRHKHPRIRSIGVESNRWGRRARESVGLPLHGTTWVSGIFDVDEIKDMRQHWPEIPFLAPSREEQKESLFPVPANCIPYTTIRSGHFDLDQHRFKGTVLRGWRPLLEDLVTAGVLYPHEELSFLTGVDTWKTSPKHFHL